MKFHLLFIFLMILSCSKSDDLQTESEINPELENWIVSSNDLKGGLGLFEVMNAPTFVNVNEITELDPTSKVALISFKGEVRVYPYFYTNLYEVVNDTFFDKEIAVSYCPITKSGICFDRNISGTTYEIIASGYLYKDNMVPSDKNHNFFWSQMLMEFIGGDFQDKNLSHYNLIETQWKTIVDFFPNAKVFYSEDTGARRAVSNKKNTISDTEYIYGISTIRNTETIELFSYDNFENEMLLESKIINNRNVIIIGDKSKLFVTSYYIPASSNFSLLDASNFPNILEDNHGNIYTIFGYVVEGPNTGEQLESPKAFVAQYWAWKEFYDDLKFN